MTEEEETQILLDRKANLVAIEIIPFFNEDGVIEYYGRIKDIGYDLYCNKDTHGATQEEVTQKLKEIVRELAPITDLNWELLDKPKDPDDDLILEIESSFNTDGDFSIENKEELGITFDGDEGYYGTKTFEGRHAEYNTLDYIYDLLCNNLHTSRWHNGIKQDAYDMFVKLNKDLKYALNHPELSTKSVVAEMYGNQEGTYVQINIKYKNS